MPAAHLPFTPELELQLRAWLAEDIGRGDLTAAALAGRPARAHGLAKAPGVFCGGVLLEPDARKTVVVAYQERKKDEINHSLLAQSLPLGLVPLVQARLLARAVRDDGAPCLLAAAGIQSGDEPHVKYRPNEGGWLPFLLIFFPPPASAL